MRSSLSAPGGRTQRVQGGVQASFRGKCQIDADADKGQTMTPQEQQMLMALRGGASPGMQVAANDLPSNLPMLPDRSQPRAIDAGVNYGGPTQGGVPSIVPRQLGPIGLPPSNLKGGMLGTPPPFRMAGDVGGRFSDPNANELMQPQTKPSYEDLKDFESEMEEQSKEVGSSIEIEGHRKWYEQQRREACIMGLGSCLPGHVINYPSR
jgi:hypothetical protein